MPLEPPPSLYRFNVEGLPEGEELLGIGADLEAPTVLAAYRSGVFPMPISRRGRVGWWSPDPRGVIPLDGLRVSRSLRASCRRFEIRFDTAFPDVLRACADPQRPGGWIRRDVAAAYTELHALGWAHSVEAWTVGPSGDALVGGLYGVAVGGLFAGESMFYRERDASKAALVGLVELLRADDRAERLLDVQWVTPHLESLGAVEVPRSIYRLLLERALPLPDPFDPPPTPR
jgi:leucyl/phenylalanyl-tRNA---protein transferase